MHLCEGYEEITKIALQENRMFDDRNFVGSLTSTTDLSRPSQRLEAYRTYDRYLQALGFRLLQRFRSVSTNKPREGEGRNTARRSPDTSSEFHRIHRSEKMRYWRCCKISLGSLGYFVQSHDATKSNTEWCENVQERQCFQFFRASVLGSKASPRESLRWLQ